MSETQNSAAAEARKENKGKPQHLDTTPQELAGFYEDLGRFNATIIARMIEDPSRIRDIRKDLVVGCVGHDSSCDSGYKYDHLSDACIKQANMLD